MSDIVRVDRRRFLQASAASGLVLGTFVAPLRTLAEATAAGRDDSGAAGSLNLFVDIAPDGQVTLVAHRSEMGQGIRTGLPQVLADELEADWSRVSVAQADGDARYGSQNTDGSRSIRKFYSKMRELGAAARQMLEAAAAERWGVDAGECRAREHAVEHRPSGRRLGFGALAEAAARQPVPAIDALRLKSPGYFRYIGQSLPIVDLDDMTHGRARYGIDVRLPGMLYAAVARPPVVFGWVKRLDASRAEAMKGVRQVMELPAPERPAVFKPLGGVAVVADDTWTAFEARKKLDIEWADDPDNAGYESDRYRRALAATTREPGEVVRERGDVDAALAGAAQTVTAEYYVPHLAQTPMEPPAAVARFEGGRCELWACTQAPQGARDTVARALGIDPSKVTVHVTLLGGGFGRKSKADFLAEAALIAREAGAPVKLTWSREDDVRHGYYHSVSAQRCEGALDGEGRPMAWLQRSAYPSIKSTFDADQRYAAGNELGMGYLTLPFEIPNIRLENGPATPHVRIGWLRSVSNIYHAFAAGCFVDELAHAAGRDPLAFQRELLGSGRHLDLAAEGADLYNHDEPVDRYPVDTARLRAVLERAAEAAGWGERELPAGHGLGLACHRSFLSYVAAVAEVAVAGDGTINVPRVDVAIDCGRVVNPDRVRAQTEGAVVWGVGIALHSEITARDGRIEQGNFDDYHIPRIEATPDTRVHLVGGGDLPTGVGEPGVPPVAPAIANGVFAATGERLRALPLRMSEAG